MKLAFLGALLLFFLFPTETYAGGGRFEIHNLGPTYGVTGKDGMYVGASVFLPETGNEVISKDEQTEFRVQNARPGDRCITTQSKVDAYGQVKGQCFAEQPGTLTIYVHSLDKGDDSSLYILTFVPSPSPTTKYILITQTVAPTQAIHQVISTPHIPVSSIPITEPTPIPTPKNTSFFQYFKEVFFNFFSFLKKS